MCTHTPAITPPLRGEAARPFFLQLKLAQPGIAPTTDAGLSQSEISMNKISKAARDASKKLHEGRWTHADRFALGAPQRLDVLEENLGRIAAHLGVELLKFKGPEALEVTAKVSRKWNQPEMLKRASTNAALTRGPAV